MRFTDINQLLEPGHLAMETGYRRLPNGQMYIAVLIPMPGCKTRWIDWWFRNNQLKYSGEKPHIYTHKGEFINNFDIEYNPKFLMDQKLSQCKFKIVDPSKYFDKHKLNDNKMYLITCIDAFYSDSRPSAHTIRFVRNTDYGCEMRIHIWLNDCTEERARLRMEHTISDWANFADYLRQKIEKLRKLSDKPGIVCKVCYSDEVIKNGFHKSGQCWLCKSCGHSFVNNGALPRMKYPVDVITKAVKDYNLGRHLHLIRNDVAKRTNCMPSNSTLYGWVKKLTDVSLRSEN